MAPSDRAASRQARPTGTHYHELNRIDARPLAKCLNEGRGLSLNDAKAELSSVLEYFGW